MQKWLGKFRAILTPQVVTFVVGVLTSIGVRALFGGIVPLTVDLLVLLTIALVVIAMATLLSVRHQALALLQPTLAARVYKAIGGPGQDVRLYDPIMQILAAATKSIRVVGLCRPPDLDVTTGRSRYYRTLTDLIETRHRHRQEFLYERIVQVENADSHEQLTPSDTDSLTYEHCAQVLDLKRRGTALTIHMSRVCPVLRSFSFLIVDDRDLIFVIPAVRRTDKGELTAIHLGTAVVFTDPQGALIGEMLALFHDLQFSGREILTVSPAPPVTT